LLHGVATALPEQSVQIVQGTGSSRFLSAGALDRTKVLAAETKINLL
jgi:hypothetical protein